MGASLPAELARVIEAVAILSPTCFTFAGRPVELFGTAAYSSPGPQRVQPPLVTQLQLHLYQYGFCRRFDGTLPDAAPAPAPDDDLLPQLSAHNAGRERWERGWQIVAVLPSGQVHAERGDISRLLWPGEFVSEDGFGVPPRQGAAIRLFAPSESTTVQPGFYFAFGDPAAEPIGLYAIVRFYWHVGAAGAPALLRALTARLNRFQVPYRFKCLRYRSLYGRRDAAVLFVSRRFFRLSAELLPAVYAELRADLDVDSPLFSKALAPGLGLAEDPGSGDSFGMHRCGLVAEGLWEAFQRGLTAGPARLEAVADRFQREGLSLERPYLNAGSNDDYAFPDCCAAG